MAPISTCISVETNLAEGRSYLVVLPTEQNGLSQRLSLPVQQAAHLALSMTQALANHEHGRSAIVNHHQWREDLVAIETLIKEYRKTDQRA
jgi:hypothetical protein